MPAPLRTPALALAGLIGMVPIALGLLRATLTLEAAGLRAAVLLAGLMVVERLVLPMGALLLGPARRRDDRPPG